MMRTMSDLAGTEKHIMKIHPAVEQFDHAPDSALVSLATACTIADQSRATMYRHHKAGRLPFVKLNKSTRIRVGDLRRLIGAAK